MNRTFHHRFTLSAKCLIALLGLLAFWLFWQRMPLVASVVVMMALLMMERVLHGSYTLTDNQLLIDRGRFARRREIRLCDIVRCTPMKEPLAFHTICSLSMDPANWWLYSSRKRLSSCTNSRNDKRGYDEIHERNPLWTDADDSIGGTGTGEYQEL